MSYNLQTQHSQRLQALELPQHVAFIMDGNGRWATRSGQDRSVGHSAGVQTVKLLVKSFLELKIPVLTLYAFSTENWKRPRQEVQFLMRLFDEVIRKECESLNEQGVCLRFLGQRQNLEPRLQELMAWSEARTAQNKRLKLNLAINYGGRSEITQAAAQIARDVLAGTLQLDEIQEERFAAYLDTAGLPEPDLLVRTSGEMRLSNFLLWQLAYTELYVTDSHWPDFDREQLIRAFEHYHQRQRRFGAC